MKNLYYVLLVTLSLMLVGCGNAQYSMNEGIEPPEDRYEQEADRVADDVMRDSEPLTPEEEEKYEKEYEKQRMSYLGMWVRTATYVNGGLEGETPATLAFAEDGTYYSQTDMCMTSGTYEVTGDNALTMVMIKNGCPTMNIPLPFTVSSTFSIEKKEDDPITMTIVTGPVTETYIRN